MRNSDLIDALPDAVCVVDSFGNVLQSNRPFQRKLFTGHSDATSAILRQIDALNFAQDILHSEHRRKFYKAVNMIQSKVFASEESPSIALRFSKTLMKASTKLYPVFRLIHWTMSATSKENCFILVGRDPDVESVDVDVNASGNPVLEGDSHSVTSLVRKRLSWNEALFDSSESMTSELIDFFENAPIALHWLSVTGHILWANKCELELLGYSAEEYIGHPLAEFLMPGEEESLMDIFGKVAVGAVVHDAPLKLKAKNGESKHTIVDTSVYFKPNGSFAHTRCFVRSDTSRQLKEDLLESKIKVARNHVQSKSAFIRNVFHEIRTPMHVLTSFFSESDPSREDFEDMRHHTDAIMGIVDDLTFSTAFEAGEVSPMYPVPTHIPSILAQVVDAVNAVEQKPGGHVAIKLHCDEVNADAEDVVADPYFRRVLFGLMSNAVKFSPLNGVVDVTVSFKSAYDDSCLASIGERVEEPALRHRPPAFSPISSAVSMWPSEPSETPEDYSSRTTRSASLVEAPVEPNGRTDYVTPSGFVPPGTFTFHFRNSTVKPMNVSETRCFFKKYYHGVTETGDVVSELTSFSTTSDSNRFNGSMKWNSENNLNIGNNRAASPHNAFHDLKQYEGLGLGLYTAFNMVTLMGGTLECSADLDEANFWFTIPSSLTDLSSGLSSPPTSNQNISYPMNIADAATIEKTRKIFEKERFRRRSTSEIVDGKKSANLFSSNPPVLSVPSFAILSDLNKISPKILSPMHSTRRTMMSEFNEMRVLVVDDSRICQKVAARALSGLDFVVEFASNGQEAIDKLAEVPQRFDAVLMDLRMPVMDGLTAIRRCRGDLGLKKLPIVALTAEVGLSIKEEAMKAGASWFLSKPTRSQELICVLRALSFAK